MKPDVLERLLMDSALGRLDPDVEALLADHLDGDPAAATRPRAVLLCRTRGAGPNLHSLEWPRRACGAACTSASRSAAS